MTTDPSWFREARYGMFIHFGLYSVIGRHEWAMCHDRIPPDEYRRLTAGSLLFPRSTDESQGGAPLGPDLVGDAVPGPHPTAKRREISYHTDRR
ncbi:alpha-L-fucosidase [bacterium]|nr:alpha-L-fucosidase [bacterium]